MKRDIVIGARESRLALWQANWVRARLLEHAPDAHYRIVGIKTLGDQILDTALAKIGDKGLFTKELELALQRGKIDLAVHSMKDLPTVLPAGLVIGAVCRREHPGDALVSRKHQELDALPGQALIGTSSLRRAAQLLHKRGDLRLRPLRGNVETRLRKMDEERLDAVVLAAAALQRLGLDERITQLLPPEICLPAVGQGAIGVEIRAGDEAIQNLVGAIEDPDSRTAIMAERAFLGRLEGGCQIPAGALGVVAQGRLRLEGVVASPDGRQLIRASLSGPAGEGAATGVQLADKLVLMGAGELLRQMRAGGLPS